MPCSWHTLCRAHLALLPIPLLVVEAQLRNGVCADDLRHVEPVLHRRHGDLHFIRHMAFGLLRTPGGRCGVTVSVLCG